MRQRSTTRAAALASTLALAVLTALPCVAEEGFDILDGEILTAEERAERELTSRRKAAPVLACDREQLDVRVTQDQTASATITIRNDGGQTMQWSVDESPSWLTPDATSGSVPFEGKRTLSLTVNASGLEAGPAVGGLVISAPGATGSPLTVAVALDVSAALEPVEEPESEPMAPEPLPDDDPLRTNPVAPPGRSKGGFGVRAGYLLPATGDSNDYDANALVGVHYRSGGSKLSYEVGVDVAEASASDGLSSSRVMTGRLDLLIGKPKGAYVLSGLGGLMETHEDTGGSTNTYNVGTFSLGGGIAIAGKLDLRLTYSLLLGSENVGGMSLVTVGANF